MTTTRLIERWLPIAELSEEATRERRSMTALPPNYYLHVWWARRPLVASRAAVLASILPSDSSKSDFMHALGIHGDPLRGAALLDKAKRTGIPVSDPYGYKRAFNYAPNRREIDHLLGKSRENITVLDPTAGGGAIPLESVRLGLNTLSNDLNPVAAFVEKVTIEFPLKHGESLRHEYASVSERFRQLISERLTTYIPASDNSEENVAFLWARTVSCPYCAGEVPLSPNWRLAPSGTGIRLKPKLGNGSGTEGRVCEFEVVSSPSLHSEATVIGGDGACPFPDCARPINGDEIKKQAQAGEMGDRLFAVVVKRPTTILTKTGKERTKWVRGYRAPTAQDDNSQAVSQQLDESLPEWEALDLIPSEGIPELSNYDRGHKLYGMMTWRDMFSNRQLLAHGNSCAVLREMIEGDEAAGSMTDLRRAAYCYIAVAIDKLVDYNSRVSAWHGGREVIEHTFRDHAFVLKWSYVEMNILAEDMGLDWAIRNTSKALSELIQMVRGEAGGGLLDESVASDASITITNTSGASLMSVADKSIDAVVMDPPYGANVMYAELSDFFYVWLKRTAGRVLPELFTRRLADKDAEAVANRAHFKGQKGAARLADDDYRVKMEGIFAECRRVLKDDGIMTVMFTHKDTGAWDALAMSLMDAGFVITASWPVNTEASGSLHIKDKAAANSTIFLVCRPREDAQGETMYWEDVEPEVARAVRARVGEFQQAGIQGVDLYLASFGPALEAFSRHWPLTRGTPAPEPKKKRRTQGDMFEEFDPYAVRPEDALNAARREVKAWRLAQLASAKAQADMDGPTAFYVLAWDAFKAVSFPYDEALRLARAVGVDLEAQVIGRLAEKKAAEIKLWDSATRVAKGAIGPADGSRGMIDALHHAAHVMRTRGAEAAQEMLEQAGVAKEDEFKVAMEALLEVLPPSKTFSGIDADKAVKPAADDFDALEKLRRIAYEGEIGEPQQLELYRELMAAE